MSDTQDTTPSAELARIVESARRLGVELDEAEALQWLAALAVPQSGGDVVVDVQSGVFGHKISMLDFSTGELDRFRRIARLVGLEDRPGVVETALALSGSAAQSKIQTYPGDCDYFQRVNIRTPTREEACRILGDILREKAVSTERGPSYRLIEVKLGSYPFDVDRAGIAHKKGTPVVWSPADVRAGEIHALHTDGTPAVLGWDDLALEPGWCKLDWVVADPDHRRLANASNMLDVTWEAPDGTIMPLDGYLDPYFQEIYLEADSVPIFSKLVRHVSADALDDYVAQLENEIRKYLSKDINYGKAAKRMYNVFRFTGRYVEAAYVRELFDEPATVLYQVWSLIRTTEEATQPGSPIPIENAIAQADELLMSVVKLLEGEQESEIVKTLLRLRDSLARLQSGQERTAEVEAARARVINVVNNFFRERLMAVPEIRDYMADFT